MAMNPQDLMQQQAMMQGQSPNTPDPTMGEQSQQDPSLQPQQPNQDPTMMGVDMNPEGNQMVNAMQPAPDPVEALPTVILSYMDFVESTKADNQLAQPVKAQIMLQMAQAINYLVPLLPQPDQTKEADIQLKVAEFQMNKQEKELDLQLKQQEHQMNMAMKQQELQFKQAENQMKLQQAQQAHQQKLVQNEQLAAQKAEQAKLAAQSKPTNNPNNKQGNNQ